MPPTAIAPCGDLPIRVQPHGEGHQIMAVLILVALFFDTISAASFRYPFAASARGRKSPAIY
jgi:hypothetical protein